MIQILRTEQSPLPLVGKEIFKQCVILNHSVFVSIHHILNALGEKSDLSAG